MKDCDSLMPEEILDLLEKRVLAGFPEYIAEKITIDEDKESINPPIVNDSY